MVRSRTLATRVQNRDRLTADLTPRYGACCRLLLVLLPVQTSPSPSEPHRTLCERLSLPRDFQASLSTCILRTGLQHMEVGASRGPISWESTWWRHGKVSAAPQAAWLSQLLLLLLLLSLHLLTLPLLWQQADNGPRHTSSSAPARHSDW